MKTYLLSDLKPIPEFFKEKFASLENEPRSYPSRDEAEIYKAVISGRTKLETIIVIEDMLKGKNRINKKYVMWVRTERCSLIQEKVNRYIRDNNSACQSEAEKMAKEKKIEVWEAYDLLMRRWRNRFLNEYQQRMGNPQNWVKKKKELTRDRFYYQIERIYDMPSPWKHWDYRNTVVQTCIMTQNGQTTFISGGSGSSGQRENHSRYGFLFARCQNKGIDIPTHILVYDDHNKFRYLMSSKSLLLSSHDLGSNYTISSEERKRILKNIPLLHVNLGLWGEDRQFRIEIGKES